MLKDLLATSEIDQGQQNLQPINELKAIKDKVAKETEVHCKSSIEAQEELHKTEARIKKIITEDEVLQKLQPVANYT
ncbi:MAG: hypothetical protein IPH33_16380 [Bacteroidetes bacterium]|nr:hypothetical protein [Bacteroidota bacterium]